MDKDGVLQFVQQKDRHETSASFERIVSSEDLQGAIPKRGVVRYKSTHSYIYGQRGPKVCKCIV